MKVLITDRHVLFRQGLVSLLKSQPGFSVCGEANNQEEMVVKVLELRPDIVLLVVDSLDESEVMAVKTVMDHDKDAKVVVVTQEINNHLIISYVQAGVKGVTPKNISMNKLVAALNAVERGEVAFPRKFVHWIVDELVRMKLLHRATESRKDIYREEIGLDALTSRELDVLRELSTGAANRVIAERLFIAENTVRVHVHNIFDKLGLKNRQEAKEFAFRQGLTDD